MQGVQRVEAHIGAGHLGQLLEDLPFASGQPEGRSDRPKPLGATLPVRVVAVLLQVGGRREHRVREDLHRLLVDVDDHLVPNVLQGPPGERAIGEVPERIGPDQEEHVDLARRGRLENGRRAAAGAGGNLAPDRRDRRAVRVVRDRAAAR